MLERYTVKEIWELLK